MKATPINIIKEAKSKTRKKTDKMVKAVKYLSPSELSLL